MDLSSQHPREEFIAKGQMYSVCMHMKACNAGSDLDYALNDWLCCQLSHNAADKDCACMGVHQCASCPVEYQIDIVDLGKKGTAFCTTKWLSFGAGNSTTDSK
jgi:hypothetical protein